MATATRPASLPAGDGVTFPLVDGGRPTTPTGRAIFADAARAADPELADRIAAARDWRKAYLRAVRELTVAAAASPAAALAIAEAGLGSMRERVVVERDARDAPLTGCLAGDMPEYLATRTVKGGATPVTELRVPYRGEELRGDALRRQLERWVENGVFEPSVAAAVGRVMDHPDWLRLEGRRVAIAGAGSQMGPLEPLAAWGADVLALDVPDERVWERILRLASHGAGSVAYPVAPDGRPGADLVCALPEVRRWIDDAAGGDDLVLGMYAYADGGMHVRVTAAFDTLAADLLAKRANTALAYLVTPTDTFVVPDELIAGARARWRQRRARRITQAPLRAASAGRLFAPAFAGGDSVADALVAQQGPNYALAKRLQRWRALSAAADAHTVSANVAPSAWTPSVTKNRVLAAAYAGAGRFGVEIFEPDTCRVLMAALLVHDLHRPPDPPAHPELLFADQAAHGGLWNRAYEPRSALGIAALIGLVRPRRDAARA